MKILVTGANGFIGKNLCARLECTTEHEILKSTRETTDEQLYEYIKECDFIYHLAGVNRPEDNDYSFNEEYTEKIVNDIEFVENYVPIVYSSSTHAENIVDPYGVSKKHGEKILKSYSRKNNTPVYIYRLSNVFGKWCKPNYNSVVATFCYNISRDKKINIAKDSELALTYIDDVVNEFVRMLDSKVFEQNEIPKHATSVVEVAERIMKISEMQQSIKLDTMENNLDKYLYATYLSYLPFEKLVGNTTVISDERGSFSELIRGCGQVSVNVVKPYEKKGGHWHDTKTERFFVVSGTPTVIIGDTSRTLAPGQYIDIPCGTVHSIINNREKDAVVVIWCNEFYNENKPDTMIWR